MSATALGFSRDAQADTAEQIKQLKPPAKPVIVTRLTGDQSAQQAYQMLLDGVDTLEAAHHICVGRENDPTDHSVGLGGLPNEEGVVELDSCCMHGPSRNAGSVGGVRNIKNVCLVARKVFEHTSHVMLIGEGAEKFAVDLGFPREILLTGDARKVWLLWKESNSQMDWWGPGISNPNWKDPYADKPAPKPTIDLHGLSSLRPGSIPRHPGPGWNETIRASAKKLTSMAADLGIPPEQRLFAAEQVLWPTTGTIHVSAVNTKGEMSGAHDHLRSCVEAPRTPRRLSHPRCRLLHRPGRRLGRCHWFRRRKHQGRRRSHDHRTHAPRLQPEGCWHGNAAPHRA